jgi:Protein of unknown function (DUF2786)
MAMVDKIKKLLLQAQSPAATPAEAAAFSLRARELMQQFKIEECDISLAEGKPREVEKVEEGVLEEAGKRAKPWRVTLATALARAFHSRCYYQYKRDALWRLVGGSIRIVGRPSDAQAVRYLHGYLCLEIDRLADEGYAKVRSEAQGGEYLARPSVWKSSFRDGAINVIASRLKAQMAEERQAFMARVKGDQAPEVEFEGSDEPEVAPAAEAIPMPAAHGSSVALVRMDEEEADRQVKEEWTRIMGPRGGSSCGWGGGKRSLSGYGAGREAGGKLRLGGGRGLPASAKRIGT